MLGEKGERRTALRRELPVLIVTEIGGKSLGGREQAEFVGRSTQRMLGLEDPHLQVTSLRAQLRHHHVVVSERLADRRDILPLQRRCQCRRADFRRAVHQHAVIGRVAHRVSPLSRRDASSNRCRRVAVSKSAAPSNSPRSMK